ncbi:tyrosine-type recombinase/integrase [Bradyrhizobium sp. CSA207]|uniref:tyrosine-type recombinase/integrase n=1 Tax=Bradyrhizobium sp. CSA207 TaxID=2698826 RepID=UPI0023B15FB2|nr:tyrosine-type recombinase/integrase [Bradyrhizobium sp. CSA207]
MAKGPDQQHVFVNRHGHPLTRDGIAYILSKHASAAAAQDRPTLVRKRITPHVLRHSCAVAPLQSGTDVTVIRDYLGHTSVATTGRYIATPDGQFKFPQVWSVKLLHPEARHGWF